MTGTADSGAVCVLVNLMPDGAFVATEHQWLRLISPLGGGRRMTTIPDDRRSESIRHRIGDGYIALDEVMATNADMVIVTGAEPEAADIRDERSWSGLVELFDWALTHSRALVLSCQAAHSFLAHLDGLSRHRLATKCSGVFEQHVSTDHPLVRGVPETVLLPHSRLNAVETLAVARRGWDILVSSEAGWGVITRRFGHCRVLAIQGHFEYEADSLLREFRRDVARYLRSERPDFPEQPSGYFGAGQNRVVERVRSAALAGETVDVDLLVSDSMTRPLRAPWRPAGARILSNVMEEAKTAEAVLPSC